VENPFRYGRIVRGAYFADRGAELKELEREAHSGGRVFLVSPRRFGKTCLLFNLLDRLRAQGMPCAYLDLNAFPMLAGFSAAVAAETARSIESGTDRLSKMLASFTHLRPRVDVAPDGSMSIGAEVASPEGEPLEALLEALDHAESLAARRGRRMLIMFDEFSDIAKYDGERLEKALRSSMQRHEHLSYVMAGSAQSVMISMVREEGRPFYRLGRIMELGPIPRDAYAAFISGWFERGGYGLPGNAVHRILDLGDDVPHSIQRLCHVLWEAARGRGQIAPGDIEHAPDVIAQQDSPLYEMLWQNASQLQRSLLIALVEDSDLSPLSKEFMLKHRLGPPSSIQASLRSLMKKGLVTRTLHGDYELTDRFMGCWIRSVLQGREGPPRSYHPGDG